MAGIRIYQPTRDLYDGIIAATGGKGSGIAARKRGYHNSRQNNPSYDYSVRQSWDKEGPADGAAALDITLSTSKMKKYTKLLMDAMARGDDRAKAMREVIGTVDGRNVVRYTRESPNGSPRWASSDNSHLWHIHISLYRKYINSWDVLKGILEIITGAPVESKPAAPAPTNPPSKKVGKPAPKPRYAFPLSNNQYFGPKSGPSNSVSGYYGRRFKGVKDNTWLKRFGTQLSKRGWSVGKGKSYLSRYGNDGLYGNEYEALIKAFQRDQGLVVDGLLGPNTWHAAFNNPIS